MSVPKIPLRCVWAIARLTPQDVEPDGLGQRSALSNDDLVTSVDSESGRTVGSEVLVPLLVTPVLGDAMNVTIYTFPSRQLPCPAAEAFIIATLETHK
jgi:hypothetical protein